MGKDIQIDGDACRVRCLLEDKNGGSDWDDMLDASEDNNIIHWSGTYSLGPQSCRRAANKPSSGAARRKTR